MAVSIKQLALFSCNVVWHVGTPSFGKRTRPCGTICKRAPAWLSCPINLPRPPISRQCQLHFPDHERSRDCHVSRRSPAKTSRQRRQVSVGVSCHDASCGSGGSKSCRTPQDGPTLEKYPTLIDTPRNLTLAIPGRPIISLITAFMVLLIKV